MNINEPVEASRFYPCFCPNTRDLLLANTLLYSVDKLVPFSNSKIIDCSSFNFWKEGIVYVLETWVNSF